MENFIITIKAMASFAAAIIGIIVLGSIAAMIVSALGFDHLSGYVLGVFISFGAIGSVIHFWRELPSHPQTPSA